MAGYRTLPAGTTMHLGLGYGVKMPIRSAPIPPITPRTPTATSDPGVAKSVALYWGCSGGSAVTRCV